MKLTNIKAFTTRMLVCLVLAAASISGLSGRAEAATCLTCHAPVGSTTDIRPVESTYRNITTGSIVGSHAKHIPAATILASACTDCHGLGAATYGTDHRNGFINVTSASGVGYSKKTSFPQSGSTTLVLGSCSAASCHANPYGAGTVTTPVWGTAAANCTACHTTPIGATGPATGSHTTTTAHAVVCTTCHAAGTTATSTPSTGHNNGTIDVANVGYPLAKTKGSAAATCSTASCHINVYGAGSVTTPVWGTSASCNACHTVAIDATGPATGSHVAHNDTTCTDCHAAGTTQITKPTTGHLDGNVTVTNGYPVTAKHAAGSYSGTCSTAACHADPYSAGLVATPVWGTASGCAACHTGTKVITANGPATGSHTNTVSHAVACTTCHAAGTTATTKPSTGHADGNIDVANVGYPLDKVKGSAATTCSAASCHADPYSAGLVTTPVWGTTGNGCAACHTGTKVITATGPATGSHTNTTSHAVACTTCHAAGTTATTVPSTGHADGNIDVANVGYTLNKTKGSAATTCSAASCHADPYSAGLVVTPVWGTTGNGCAACHTGTKVITATGPATGSHTNTTSHAVACITCHAAGTTASAVPSTGHADGNIDVANVGYPLDKVKGSAATTCSAASCHADPYSAGLVTTPVWGTTGNGCAACHTGTKVITATGPATGSHTNTTSHAVACITCHAVGTTATTVPSIGHADGNIDVANVGYPIDKVKGSAATTCSVASCHADPYSAATVVTPVWGTTGNGCAACHTGTKVITANGPATGSHTNVTSHAVACITCHAAGTTATAVPSTGHADGNIDVANVGYPLDKVKGSAATTCSAASCHADPYSAGLVTTPVWGTTGNGCAACHTGTKVITATGPATGSHTNTASHAVACITCHAAGTTATSAPSTGHADGNIDVANVGYPIDKVKGSAATTCSTASCHADPYSAATVVTPVWGTTGNGCAACHTGTKVITATGPATGSHALAGHAAACVTCHEVGTTATTAPTVGHNDGNIDTANIGYATLNKTKGSAGTTCSTASCHVSPVSTANVVTPAWGTTGNGCAACHSGVNAITASGPATGSHALHGSVAACAACHATGTTATTAPSSANGHNDGNIDIVNVGYATLNKTKGSAGVSCSTALCHGSSSPAWGVNTTNDSCTKCHGTPTTTGVITAAANNRYLVAPPLNLAKSAGTVTVGEIGQVSSDAKVGAHQTHLRFLNGFSNYSTVDFRCQSCHGTLPTSGTHANGSAAPAFQGLANNRGAMTATYTAVTGTCANTYCHNPAGTGGKLSSANAGTATSPVWTNAAYLDPSAANKTQTNCNKCHLTPADAGFTSTKIHTANITQDCAGCHGHNGETSGEIGKRHLDGIKWGGGDCNTCHGYQAGSWATAPTINAEGKGAHEKHITYLTTKRFTITLSPTTDTYAGLTTAWTNVCGICHGNTAGNHQNNSVNVALDQTYLFGTSPTVAQYNGTPGVSSALTAKTCSNISCHYFTTPVWSTY